MIQQNTQEWMDLRKNHIGASDAPIIMGQSPWKTSFALWEEKLGLRPSPKMNAAMMRGHKLEPIARQAYNDYTGNAAEAEVVFHPERKWMMASLDGISLDRSIIVEIKCPGKKDHDEAKAGRIPDKYYAQLQHQLATISLNLLHYFSYKDGEFHLIEVERDEEFIQKLYSEERDFWNKLQNFEPPTLEKRDFIQKEDENWITLAQQWVNANQELNDLKEKEKQYRQMLIDSCCNQNCHGGGVKVQKVIRKGSVDYKSVPELEGINLEKYRKANVETWRLSC
jgi:putative phage-type endonuclease